MSSTVFEAGPPKGWHCACSIGRYPPSAAGSPPRSNPVATFFTSEYLQLSGLGEAADFSENQSMRALNRSSSPVAIWTSSLALTLALISPSPTQAMHVLVDPGHGGIDTGAVRGKYKEAEIALKVSLKLADLLKKDPRFKVSMTRETDSHVTLSRRTQIAKDTKADLFLSIHLNSSTDPRAHGKEFYFQNQIPADEEALYLASKENEQDADDLAKADAKAEPRPTHERLSAEGDVKLIIDDLHRNHRVRASGSLSKILLENWVAAGHGSHLGSHAIRQAPFHVVSTVDVPSVLVEVGYLTNSTEAPLLASAQYQDELAKSLYQGLVKFKETMDKEQSHPLNSETNLSP